MILNKLRIITIFFACLLSASTSVLLGTNLTLDSNIFNVSLGIASKGQFYSPSTSKSSTLYIIGNSESVNIQIGGSVYFEKVELREIEGLDKIGANILTSQSKSTASYDPIDFQLPALSYDGIYAILTYYKDKINGVCYIARNPKNVNGFAYTYNTATVNTASLIEYVSALPTEVSIPADVTISNGGESASFKVTYLWDECLSGCSRIEKLTIPNTVSSIGFSAFKGCKGLKNLIIEDGDNTLDIDKYALNSSTYITPFYDCPLESVYIGRKGGGASDQNSSWFTGQKKLTSVSFGTSITDIGGYMFYNCSLLDNIILPDGIKNINQYAFAGCTSLTKINLPNGLSKIEWYAFNNCSGLKGIILPESITKFGLRNYVGPEVYQPASVFNGCTSLADVICLYPSSVGNPKVPSTAKLFVPDAVSYKWGEDIATIEDNECTYTSFPVTPKLAGNYSAEFADLYNIQLQYIANVDIVNAGTYSLDGKIRLLTGCFTYEYTKSLDYKVNRAPITIIAQSCDREYGENNPTFTYDVNGWLGSDNESSFLQTPVISTSADISSEVGEYSINISDASLKNYVAEYTPGILTIKKAPLSIMCPDYTRQYGKPNPEVQLIYSGFRNGENESVLEVAPTIRFTADSESPVGEYSIYATNAIALNYSMIYKNGTLTIVKANQTIDFGQTLFGDIFVGADYELNASSTSGNQVRFFVYDSNAAKIYNDGNGSKLYILSDDEFNLKGYVSGNANYEDASRFIHLCPKIAELESISIGVDNSYNYVSWEIPLIENDTEAPQILCINWESPYAPYSDINVSVNNNDCVYLTNINAYDTEAPHDYMIKAPLMYKIKPLSVGETTIKAYSLSKPEISATLTIKVYDNSAGLVDTTLGSPSAIMTDGNYLINTDNKLCQVITLDGVMIYNGTDRRISLNPGIYIVRIGSLTSKIRI